MIQEQLRLFATWARREQKEDSTISQYSSQLTSFANSLGRDDLFSMRSEDIEARVRGLPTNAMRSRFLCGAHLFYRYAKRTGKVQDDPAASVLFAELRIDYPTDGQIRTLLRKAGHAGKKLRFSDLVELVQSATPGDGSMAKRIEGYLERLYGGRAILRTVLGDPPVVHVPARERQGLTG